MTAVKQHSNAFSPNRNEERASASFPIGVWLVSMLAVPACYILSLTSAMEDSRLVFLAGLLICTGLAPIIYLGVVRNVPAGRDVYFYVFTIFSFTSVVDFLLALSVDGRWSHWLDFYLREGEIYLTTAHGLWINVWDGTFHYCCYLLLTAFMLRSSHSYSDSSFRTVGLVWAGSILNSIIVLFVGSAVGIHATHIKPSYLLNIPYALFPCIFLIRVLQARPSKKQQQQAALIGTPTFQQRQSSEEVATRKPIYMWILDAVLLIYLFLLVSLCIFRFLVVLRSKLPLARSYQANLEQYLFDATEYPTLQMTIYAFYLTPYLIWAMKKVHDGAPSKDASSNNSEGQHDEHTAAFIDYTKISIGALMQGTFSYMLAAVYQGQAYPNTGRVEQTQEGFSFQWFLGSNILLLVAPFLLLARMQCGRNYVLKTSKIA